jgi:hypothetical protein
MRKQQISVRHRWLSRLAVLAGMLWLGSAAAESGAYRIELLVFRYTDSTQEPVETVALRDYRQAWQLNARQVVLIPEDPAPLGVMSDRMRAAWRRLEGRAGFEPLLFVNWEQSRIDYHPPIRIHDDELLLERLDLPQGIVQLDLRAEDMFAPYRHFLYRLDGTVQLRRTRFLHLDVDLETRIELVFEESTDIVAEAAAAGSNPAQPAPTLVLSPDPESGHFWSEPGPFAPLGPRDATPLPGAWVHRLRESRQVRTDDLLYFDSPYLGVLARVTATAGE